MDPKVSVGLELGGAESPIWSQVKLASPEQFHQLQN
jgi:hypothetical protein